MYFYLHINSQKQKYESKNALCMFEKIILGIQLYNKKYHQKLNHF